ncbi:MULTISPECIES: aminotransferase class I/II-fold pyridoxal phosphate-dependent enzyme [Pandoraea]|uniref:LL-diaminopimelate aminotransferase n=1 Tax=Pandoraea communis TaxID=2508297 RepID=A0A5E4XVB8_9BURK|nr:MULTISPECIES: aminotransferase class I/II-fold pyridoxal phosphate-dependent enzyme [Pandoraea]CFB61402.1 LL-diaminopimelate aminotransferase [Pandoraea apista]VVE40339.1 LL-diaminopimelate aminotransferase [Pandoraea communis]
MHNLTEEQISALSNQLNLADGHAYRELSAEESAIIQNLPRIFMQVDRMQQREIELAYVQTFLGAARQTCDHDAWSYFMCFTASIGLEVVANYLRLEKRTAALIEPCFDNLHDILRRHDVPLQVFPEAWMQSRPDELPMHLERLEADVLFLVAPNNPSGMELPQENLQVVIDFCEKKKCLLVLDATFRFFQRPGAVYDQYAMLARSGIDCILIEDTGKTWPTKEIKAPFFSVSMGLAPRIAHIYSDFILHVSPVAIELLRNFVALGTEQVHAVIAANRLALQEALEGTCLCLQEGGRMSVAWLQVTGPRTATQWQALMAEHGLSVLTGVQFYWAHPHAGEKYLRVALQRNPAMFQLACTRLRALLTAEG